MQVLNRKSVQASQCRHHYSKNDKDMNKISQIVIMNYHKRKKEGQYLKKLIEVSAKPYGIPVQLAFDDGSLSVWGNFAQALTMGGGTDGNYRIVIHDDMTFDRNILDKIIHILECLPENKILMLYNPTNQDYTECYEKGRHVLETSCNFWAQCGLYPNELAKEFVDEMNLMSKEDRADDDRLAGYLQRHNMTLFSVVPAFIQHLGAYRSTFNIPGSINGVERNSSTVDTQFDVGMCNWYREFASPYKSKMNKDYVKIVYKEEYLCRK